MKYTSLVAIGSEEIVEPKNEDFIKSLAKVLLVTIAGVSIKVVMDRLLYKLEESVGSRLNDAIFNPKRYGNTQSTGSTPMSSTQSSISGFGSNGLFNSQSSSWSNNPFR